MSYVISAGTFVSGLGAAISVNLDLSPQIQRLYQLGSSVPYNKNIISQKRLSVTSYGGSGTPSYSVAASVGCTDANTIAVSVNATACDGSAIGASHNWYVTGYSYTKDPAGWGQESWSLVTAPESSDGGIATMIRGIAEGSATIEGASVGVTFTGDTVDGESIQVQAGSPGIGRANNSIFGEVSSVGGGTTGQGNGLTGSANVSVPYSPLYLG
jgi:hypothetical protein